ncbi:MAG TPA: hypothetical protein VHB78_06725 [Vicinamibacterales bacterium]|nr:hypothetical protein [Vicinamibacterales bacterium]
MKFIRYSIMLAAACVPAAAAAQDGMPDMPGMTMHAHMEMSGAPLGIADGRDGSGTSWLPDDTPASGSMWHVRDWMLMAHGQAFLQAIDVTGDRGDRQAGSVNWAMGMAQHALWGGQLTLRAMTSLEPLTVGRCGYPDLAQSGESCRGVALHDRQHPHDVFMETAARYQRAVGDRVAIEIYGGPAGEPALGPVAYPHRPSAAPDLFAPIAHHWLDATHVSFGVLTAGVYGRRWKAEASAFNGREPDDARYGFDVARLDSWSTRVSWLPSPRLAVQVSTGLLHDVDHHDDDAMDVRRTTASATYHRRTSRGLWTTTAAWGVNREHGESSQAWLAETAVDVSASDVVFARAECVQKSAADLALPDSGAPSDASGIIKVQAGYTRWLAAAAGLRAGIGGSIGVARVPSTAVPAYGSKSPIEMSVFFRLSAFAKATADKQGRPRVAVRP